MDRYIMSYIVIRVQHYIDIRILISHISMERPVGDNNNNPNPSPNYIIHNEVLDARIHYTRKIFSDKTHLDMRCATVQVSGCCENRLHQNGLRRPV